VGTLRAWFSLYVGHSREQRLYELTSSQNLTFFMCKVRSSADKSAIFCSASCSRVCSPGMHMIFPLSDTTARVALDAYRLNKLLRRAGRQSAC
jgi:hypothetical protein